MKIDGDVCIRHVQYKNYPDFVSLIEVAEQNSGLFAGTFRLILCGPFAFSS